MNFILTLTRKKSKILLKKKILGKDQLWNKKKEKNQYEKGFIISRLENGEKTGLTTEDISRIADYFDIPIAFLYFDAESIVEIIEKEYISIQFTSQSNNGNDYSYPIIYLRFLIWFILS